MEEPPGERGGGGMTYQVLPSIHRKLRHFRL